MQGVGGPFRIQSLTQAQTQLGEIGITVTETASETKVAPTLKMHASRISSLMDLLRVHQIPDRGWDEGY